MENFSQLLSYELFNNNNKISHEFYWELDEFLEFEKPDKDRFVFFLKNLKNPEDLVRFWLS